MGSFGAGAVSTVKRTPCEVMEIYLIPAISETGEIKKNVIQPASEYFDREGPAY